jgi:hypothetical protein
LLDSRLPVISLLACLVASCGGTVSDGAPTQAGASPDAGGDAPQDAAPDAPTGAGADAGADAPGDAPVGPGMDAQPADAPVDAPALDATAGATADASTDASTPLDSSFTSPTVLVSNIYLPHEIAVDEVNVYFTALNSAATNDSVYQIPKNAAGATPIELSGNDKQPYSLASDGTYVYWNDTISPGAVRRIVVGGNGATTLANVDALGMSLSPTTLFWVSSSGAVQSMPKAGGPVTTLGAAPSGEPWGVAIDATYFYFAATSTLSATISRVPQSGVGPVETVATPDADVTVLATDAANVYFIAGDNLSAVPTGGGAVTVLASGFSGATSLKLDSGNLYASVTGGNGPYGSILRVPVTGGTPTVLASAQWGAYDVAVDATYVYWTNFGGPTGTGTVMVAPK